MSRHNWLTSPPTDRPRYKPAIVHGRRATYNNAGCRCDLCKAANATHAREGARRRQEAAMREIDDLLPCRRGCCVERPTAAPTPLQVHTWRDPFTGQSYDCEVVWNGTR